MKRLVIGTDEAGYGPNLGPLVISGSAWTVDSSVEPSDLHPALNHIFQLAVLTSRNPKKVDVDDCRLMFGDSKSLFQSRGSLAPLERTLIPWIRWLIPSPRSDASNSGGMDWQDWKWSDLSECLAFDFGSQKLPWYQGFDPALPLDLPTDELIRLKQFAMGQTAMPDGTVNPFSVRARLLEPDEFNHGCRTWGNKASLLSQTTLALVKSMVDHWLGEKQSTGDEVQVFCDKHGGRNRYAAVLQSVFPDAWVHVLEESRSISRYQLQYLSPGNEPLPVEFRFSAKGESHLAVALASMVSKYVREISMKAFNDFWREQIPNVKPTAGYPADAKRFRRDVASEMKRLKLPAQAWWREV